MRVFIISVPLDAVNIQGIISKHQSDYYYKAFKTRTHLTTILLGIFSRCDSMTEICVGLRAMLKPRRLHFYTRKDGMFKKMKQNFQLHYFYGESENAIRTQVWCTLIAQLLLTVVQKIAETKKAFSVVASLLRIHLISLLDVYELLRSTRREYARKPKGPPGYELQMKLNLM
jgi:hypothetical protein